MTATPPGAAPFAVKHGTTVRFGGVSYPFAMTDGEILSFNIIHENALAARVRQARREALQDLAKWAGAKGIELSREQFVGVAVVVAEALCRARAEAEQ